MAELQELLTDQLRDLYDAEKQLTKALPKLAKAASNEQLKQAFTDHLEVTRNQVARIEQAFEHLGEKAKGKPCKAMKGLVEEGQEHLEEHERGPMRDVTLTASAEKVEHYEIAAYLSARSLARAVGQHAVAVLLQETLREEEQAGNLMLQLGSQVQREVKENGQVDEEKRPKSSGGATSRRSGKSAGRGESAQKKTAKRSGSSSSSIATTDHDEIRTWAEARGARPACVRGTGGRGDRGMIRLDFPGYSGAESLEQISWEDWFEKFDQQGLALLHQEKTAGGQQSNFNKLVKRKAAGSSSRSKASGNR